MRHYTILILITLMPWLIVAQTNRLINSFNSAQDYSGEQIRKENYLKTSMLLQEIAKKFEGDKKDLIAVLVNSQFELALPCTGIIGNASDETRINQKLQPTIIERIAARYNLAYSDQISANNYIGTINFIVPALSSPEFDIAAHPELDEKRQQLIERLKTAQEPRNIIRQVYASQVIKTGPFLGSDGSNFFAGAVIEQPLTRKISLQAELQYTTRQGYLSFEDVRTGANISLDKTSAWGIRAQVKAHLFFKYPRLFLQGGPYYENNHNLWNIRNPGPFTKPIEIDDRISSVGMHFGLGVVFYSGLFLTVSDSFVATYWNNLVDYKLDKGPAITAGWLFGKK